MPSIRIISIQARPNRQLIPPTRQLPRPLKDSQRTLCVIPHDGWDGVRIAQGAVARQDVLVALIRGIDASEGVGDAVGSGVAGVAALDHVGLVGGLHAEGGDVGGAEVGVGGVEWGDLVVGAGADGGAGPGDGGCDGGGDGGDGAGEGGGDGLWRKRGWLVAGGGNGGRREC